MTTTPVGMRCPECSRARTSVKTMRSISAGHGWEATQALIAINVVAFLAEGSSAYTISGQPFSSKLVSDGLLYAPYISINHDYYRLLTSAFLHENFLHIAFNMYLLYVLGRMLEPAIGHLRFLTIYFVALFAGSLGVFVVSPHQGSLGASGAIFGLLGAAYFEMRRRGIDPVRSGIVPTILLNLVISLTLPNISIGAHIGGLIGGALAILAFHAGDRRRAPALAYAACAVIAVASIAGAIALASSITAT
jgi:membrane associated rhomboid family serine protease